MRQFYSFATLSPHSQAAAQIDNLDHDGKSIERQQIVAVWIQPPALSSAKTFRVATACEEEKDHCPRDRHSDQATVVVTNEHIR